MDGYRSKALYLTVPRCNRQTCKSPSTREGNSIHFRQLSRYKLTIHPNCVSIKVRHWVNIHQLSAHFQLYLGWHLQCSKKHYSGKRIFYSYVSNLNVRFKIELKHFIPSPFMALFLSFNFLCHLQPLIPPPSRCSAFFRIVMGLKTRTSPKLGKVTDASHVGWLLPHTE